MQKKITEEKPSDVVKKAKENGKKEIPPKKVLATRVQPNRELKKTHLEPLNKNRKQGKVSFNKKIT